MNKNLKIDERKLYSWTTDLKSSLRFDRTHCTFDFRQNLYKKLCKTLFRKPCTEKCTEKHVLQSLFNKATDLHLVTLFEKRLWYRTLPSNLEIIFRSVFPRTPLGYCFCFIVIHHFKSSKYLFCFFHTTLPLFSAVNSYTIICWTELN